MALGIDGGAAVGVAHTKLIARNMAAIARNHAHDPGIDHAIGIGEGAADASFLHRDPLGAADEVHIVLGIAPALIRQMEVETETCRDQKEYVETQKQGYTYGWSRT